MKSTHRSRLLLALLVAIVTAALHYYAVFVDLNGEFRELGAMDTWFRMREPRTPPKELIIVRLDEETYQHLGVSTLEPFPRAHLARVVRKIAENGASALALDAALAAKQEHDQADQELTQALELLPAVIGQWTLYNRGQTPQGESGVWIQEITSDPYFLQKNVQVGVLTMPMDNYIARRFRSASPEADTVPPISEVAAGFLRPLEDRPSPRDFINFYGPSGTIPSIPGYRLLDYSNPVDRQLLQGKLVFIGFVVKSRAAGEAQDAFATPLDPRMYGVEIHATAAGNLLEQAWIRRLPPIWEQVSLTAVVFLAAFSFCILPFKLSALVFLGAIALRFYGGYALFSFGLFVPGLSATLYFLPGAFAFGWFTNFVEAQKQRAVLKDCLSRYVNPEMAKMLENRADLRRPSVERREIAVLFTDITKYTRLSEVSPEGRTGELLNKYLPVISECGMQESGVVLKSAGDGGLIIWGAPLEVDSPCDRAVRAALTIEKRLQSEMATGRLPVLKTRFGAAFGLADVGNVGAESRFDYTAEGDTVNVASRLLNMASKVGVSILVSDNLACNLRKRENLLYLGSVRLKGRRAPIKIHAVFDSPVSNDVTRLWNEALEAFSKRNWDSAAALFGKAGTLDRRLKKAAKIYRLQTLGFRRREPFSHWTGELVLRGK